jgi:hypothetical protein
MNNRSALMAGVGIGAGMIYLLDPDCGARRRARLRDTAVHMATLTTRAVGATSRDALHRTYGTASSLRRLVRRDIVDDDVLVERVRATLGRLVSHPHAIVVTATNGSVTLSGPILTHEVPRLVRATRRVRSVCDVVDQLEPHDQAADVPALQGGRGTAGNRPEVLQRRWAPSTRSLIATAGAALAVGGAFAAARLGSSQHSLASVDGPHM